MYFGRCCREYNIDNGDGGIRILSKVGEVAWTREKVLKNREGNGEITCVGENGVPDDKIPADRTSAKVHMRSK